MNDTAPPDALTLEAIRRDPWNAVNLPIPADADERLLTTIEYTAQNMAELNEATGERGPEATQRAVFRANEAFEQFARNQITENPWNVLETRVSGHMTPDFRDHLLDTLRHCRAEAWDVIRGHDREDAESVGEAAEMQMLLTDIEEKHRLVSKVEPTLTPRYQPPQEAAEPLEALTPAAIAADRWNAVDLPFPENADPRLLRQIVMTSYGLAAEKFDEMMGIRSGRIPAPDWAGEPDAPDGHEEAEGDMLRADQRAVDAAILLPEASELRARHQQEAAATLSLDEGEKLDIRARHHWEVGEIIPDIVKGEARRVFEEAPARLDAAYQAIHDGTGTVADKRAIELERDNAVRLFVAADVGGAPADDAAFEAYQDQVVASAKRIGVRDVEAWRVGNETGLNLPRATLATLRVQDTEQIIDLMEPIRETLDGLITDCEPAELDEIARDAAMANIAQRKAPGERVTVDDLSGDLYTPRRREALGLAIPDDADLYLVHRVRTAATEELDGMTNRDADPFERDELEEIARLKAREIEAGLRLDELTQDAEPEHTTEAADPWNEARQGDHMAGQSAQQAQDIPPATPTPSDPLTERISFLADAVGLADSGAARDFEQAQAIHRAAIEAAPDEAIRAALTREYDAARQDYAADLAALHGEQLASSGQATDAADMRREAEVRREIAATIRTPPEPDGATRQPDAPAEDTFKRDAEAAAREYGFGRTATLLFQQTNQGDQIVSLAAFNSTRDTFEPGQQDYSALRAEPDAATGRDAFEADMRQAEAAAQDGNDAKHYEYTRETAPFIEPSPGGSVTVTRDVQRFAEAPTDYENGPHRPGSRPEAAEAALSGLEAFDRDMNTAEDIAAAAAEITGREAEASRAHTGRSF